MNGQEELKHVIIVQVISSSKKSNIRGLNMSLHHIGYIITMVMLIAKKTLSFDDDDYEVDGP